MEPGCAVRTRRANRAGPSRYTRSFYNHFQSKDELFHAAVEDALDTFGARLDELTVGLDDPAEVFAQSFRLAARLHRREPELSKVLLHHGLALVGSDSGLAPWARRDIDAAVHAGRFSVRDPELSLAIISASPQTKHVRSADGPYPIWAGRIR